MNSLYDHFAVLKPELLLDELPVTPEIYAELGQKYADFQGHTLIAAHRFSEDWPTWEMHPAGDELVILLSGAAEFVLRSDGVDSSVHLTEPGAYVIVPKGTWHTARVGEATEMLFVTPGAGTENLETPPVSKM